MSDCIVVGGGVIGLLTARALHEKGLDVLLLERGALGGESSWAGGGIISPLYPWRYSDAVNRLAQRSKQIYPQLVPLLCEESGIDGELLNSGLLVEAGGELDSILQWGAQWSVKMEQVAGTATMRAIEPALAEAVDQGIWMPEIMQVRNPRLVKALKGSFATRKIAYRDFCPVMEIILEGDTVSGVRLEHERLSADKVVVASGAWTTQFVSTSEVAVQPVKGQMLLYRGEPGLISRMVLSEGHYVIPRKDGHVLAGSTLEKKGFDKTISENALQELHQSAVALTPVLAGLSIERQWAGLRPGTDSGIPYICEHDRIRGLYIHAGHYRNGIVLGAASAELMAALILGEPAPLDITPYAMQAPH